MSLICRPRRASCVDFGWFGWLDVAYIEYKVASQPAKRPETCVSIWGAAGDARDLTIATSRVLVRSPQCARRGKKD